MYKGTRATRGIVKLGTYFMYIYTYIVTGTKITMRSEHSWSARSTRGTGKKKKKM